MNMSPWNKVNRRGANKHFIVMRGQIGVLRRKPGFFRVPEPQALSRKRPIV